MHDAEKRLGVFSVNVGGLDLWICSPYALPDPKRGLRHAEDDGSASVDGHGFQAFKQLVKLGASRVAFGLGFLSGDAPLLTYWMRRMVVLFLALVIFDHWGGVHISQSHMKVSMSQL
jgi:hypothetical protein